MVRLGKDGSEMVRVTVSVNRKVIRITITINKNAAKAQN